MDPPLPPELEYYARDYLPGMEGWCTPDKARAMMSTILRDKPQLAVEIGVFAGRSLFAIGIAMDVVGAGTAYGIEPWEAEACAEGLVENDEDRRWWTTEVDYGTIEQAAYRSRRELGLEQRVQLIKQRACEAVSMFQQMASRGQRLDFLHIDGNHSESVSCRDVDSYVPLVRSGGEVWFDDIDWNSTAAAQRRLLNYCRVVRVSETYGVYRRR